MGSDMNLVGGGRGSGAALGGRWNIVGRVSGEAGPGVVLIW